MRILNLLSMVLVILLLGIEVFSKHSLTDRSLLLLIYGTMLSKELSESEE